MNMNLTVYLSADAFRQSNSASNLSLVKEESASWAVES